MLINYSEDIYAGVLGKIIGVYLGRPVEGLSYEKIREDFDEVDYYVHEKYGVPLVIADDDISGTFGFFKALKDYDYQNLTAKNFGDTWLNYIIEDKTILWWGGLGRSTEHTAYLRLKAGINAPLSGSIELNGRSVAEQIGAQIFVDAIAMSCPNDPDLAVKIIKESASVSHDALAVEAACFLGALQSMAFSEKNIDKLLDSGMKYLSSDYLINAINDVRDVCSTESDWRKVRDYLDSKYGYDLFSGTCHIVPNHLMVIASFILGGDDFQKSIMIATSAGWDTDSNAGNVGALNGIRLGLEGINKGVDFRKPVADLLYVVTSDGGSVITDAVKETYKIVEASYRLQGKEYKRKHKKFSFDFNGSTQGFEPCPQIASSLDIVSVSNSNEISNQNGLLISFKGLARGVTGRVSTPTFINFDQLDKRYSTLASPTIYPKQKVETTFINPTEELVSVRQYILYYDLDNTIKTIYGHSKLLDKGESIYSSSTPDTKGMPIFRLGYEFYTDKRFNQEVIIKEIDWNGAPEEFYQKGMLMNSIWDTNPFWLQTWVSSAKHFAADFKYTFCISHHEENGIATTGSSDWDDYSIESDVMFSLHKKAGLVARSNGHRRYYAIVFEDGERISIISRKDHHVRVLANRKFLYNEDCLYHVKFVVSGNKLSLNIDGEEILFVEDEKNLYSEGSAGFLIEEGTMLADGFIIKKQ
ncbi:ADP-ribosylglycohydrolase family protein [Sporosarcina sp. Marseille-Q4063]|uniref:ADP-ribosylglycohydrolase family protein n=1 Tax=Sporosarcina sp. Marseille-Q4063 TaxID=2810514 RepID=UPI001BAF3735|nr:ADP-ribosylglycohydrolase family protein [Sporosarcina sp. Marseille-Q4063]QUW23040.1 ADP-ribosylglycohydrolase family protein [Sporosarcina sp. Marseille-Q4063]